MSSPRLLASAAFAALASAVIPATASAKLTPISAFPTPTGNGQYTDWSGALVDRWAPATGVDAGILKPGMGVNVNFPLNDIPASDSDPAYDGQSHGVLYNSTSALNISYASGGPAFPLSGNSTMNTTPFRIDLPNQYVCGTDSPLRLELGAANQNVAYGMPTGAASAYQSTASYDVGNIIYDGQTKVSNVVVPTAGLAKGIRIHIDKIEHQYSTKWLKITLTSPSGKTAVLFNQAGRVANGTDVPTTALTNVWFSANPVDGVAPVTANQAATSDFTNQVIKPVDSFDVFDGDSLAGTWKLAVSDIAVAADQRSSRGRSGRSGTLTGGQMIKLGEWQFSGAPATCSGLPAPAVPAKVFIDPSTGGTVDAVGSNDPTPNDDAAHPGAGLASGIKQYEWDLDNNGSFETVTTTPHVPMSAAATGTVKTVNMRVVDVDNNPSAPVTTSVIYTKKPVVTSVVATPAAPQAGEAVSLVATATDAETTADALTYAWDLNDDGDFTDKAGPSASITWNTSGPKIVRVRVTDQSGASTVFYQTITIANLPPKSKFAVTPTPAVVGQPVTFDGSQSVDTDGTILSYEWDFDGNGTYDVKSDTPTTTFTYPQAGGFLARLLVTDNTGGTDESTFQLKVTGAPVGVVTASPTNPAVGENVTFSAQGSHDTDPGGSIAKYEWDLDGNGSYDATGVSASRSYPNPGTVSVRLRLTDNDGATSITSTAIVVRSVTTGGGQTGVPATTPPKTNPPGLKPTDPGYVDPVTGKTTPTSGTNASELTNSGFGDPDDDGDLPPSLGIADDGFQAAISAGAKQHGKKTYKKGVALAFTANDAATITIKVYVAKAAAKTVGLKIKKATQIGSGRLVLKKAGKGKFVVKIAKKYQRYVKKAKKMPVVFRAVVVSKGHPSLALAKTITFVP